ncbi:gag/pol protein [Cucumis melo var. makuwa]|uniref:Gag/pol protein n=1 Tax=Cucumis melo var. makuwa TaxID=1194695 RepID=A0A5D3CA62_CUCMM|nr:gag/pol protein [Cucumis melo var. makuwa]TYK08084.1 gag/pol protein [Cucumis melo var. makuwa]
MSQTRVVDEVSLSSRVDEINTSGQSRPSQSLTMPRRSVSQPNRYLGLTKTQVIIPNDDVEDPLSYKQTMNDVDKDQLVKAMDLEMNFMYFNSVWKLINLLEGVKPIGCRWIYKRKRGSAGKNSKDLLHFKHMVHLSKEQCPITSQEVEDMRHIPYASTMDSLMYVMLRTRPGICYSVRIVNSTMEAEYVADCEAAKKVAWLKKFLHDLEVVPNMNMPITLYCDNSGEVANSKEPRSHKQGKHIEGKYHLLREFVQLGDVIVTKIALEHNIANPLQRLS